MVANVSDLDASYKKFGKVLKMTRNTGFEGNLDSYLAAEVGQ